MQKILDKWGISQLVTYHKMKKNTNVYEMLMKCGSLWSKKRSKKEVKVDEYEKHLLKIRLMTD